MNFSTVDIDIFSLLNKIIMTFTKKFISVLACFRSALLNVELKIVSDTYAASDLVVTRSESAPRTSVRGKRCFIGTV